MPQRPGAGAECTTVERCRSDANSDSVIILSAPVGTKGILVQVSAELPLKDIRECAVVVFYESVTQCRLGSWGGEKFSIPYVCSLLCPICVYSTNGGAVTCCRCTHVILSYILAVSRSFYSSKCKRSMLDFICNRLITLHTGVIISL